MKALIECSSRPSVKKVPKEKANTLIEIKKEPEAPKENLEKVVLVSLPNLENLKSLDALLSKYTLKELNLTLPEDQDNARRNIAHKIMKDNYLLVDGEVWDILEMELYGREDPYTISHTEYDQTPKFDIVVLDHYYLDEHIKVLGIWLGIPNYSSYFVITAVGQGIIPSNRSFFYKPSAPKSSSHIELEDDTSLDGCQTTYNTVIEGVSSVYDLFIVCENLNLLQYSDDKLKAREFIFDECYFCPRSGLTLEHESDYVKGLFVSAIMKPRRYTCLPKLLYENMHMYILQASKDGTPINKIPLIFGIRAQPIRRWIDTALTCSQFIPPDSVSFHQTEWGDVNFQIRLFKNYAYRITSDL
jgi:hypothetical protein